MNTLKATYLALSVLVSHAICTASERSLFSPRIDKMHCNDSIVRTIGGISIFSGTAVLAMTLWFSSSNKQHEGQQGSTRRRGSNWFYYTNAAAAIAGGCLLIHSSYRPTTKTSRGL